MLAKARCPFTFRDTDGLLQVCGRAPVFGSYCFDHAAEVPGTILAVLEEREGKLVTVSPEQVAIARQHLQNADIAAQVANETGIPFYMLCALLEKESGGANVYGHDVGGAMQGAGEVTKENFAEFYRLVFEKGMPSNGVGPMQITWKGFFTDMEAQDLEPWDVHDNMLYGARLFMGYYRAFRVQGLTVRESIRRAGTRYNGGTAYGDSLVTVAEKWAGLVGHTDHGVEDNLIVTSLIPAGVLPNIKSICAELVAEFPKITHVWGYASTPDHNNKRCIDYMLPASAERVTVGDDIADYNWKNRVRLGLDLQIWNRKIQRTYDKPGIPAGTWAPYTGTNPHTDHVHAQYKEKVYVAPAGYPTPTNDDVYLSRLVSGVTDSDSVWQLQHALQALGYDVEFSGDYDQATAEAAARAVFKAAGSTVNIINDL